MLEPGVEFESGWVVERMAAHLEAVTRGDIRRLLINVPPGFTKSMLVNVFWPAWEWGPRGLGHHRFISASYEQGLATRDLMRCRDLIDSEWYQERWPLKMKEDQNQKTYYENSETGWRLASSVGGRLTGYRGDRIIIDDPHDVQRAESDNERATARRWFSETLPTRLNKQAESAMVMIMQRLHVHDLSGLVVEDEKLTQQWTHLCLPMEFEVHTRSYTRIPSPEKPCRMRKVKVQHDPLPRWVPDPEGEEVWPQDPRTQEGELAWEKRFPRESVEELKDSLRSGDAGEYAVTGQLQQRPVPRSGGMFRREDFQFIGALPIGVKWVRGWDLAASKDAGAWTVGVKMGLHQGRVIVADVVRLRGSSHEVEQSIKDTAAADGHQCVISIPQDPGQAGKAQRNHLAGQLHGYEVHFSLESGEKADRARPFAAQVGAQNVFLPSGATWASAFLAEAGLFPNSNYKDQVDAASRAYAWIAQNASREPTMVPSKTY